MTREEAYNKLNLILTPMMEFCDEMNKRDILECVEVLNNTITEQNKLIEVLEKQRKIGVQVTNRAYVLESKVIYLTNVIKYLSEYKDFSILLND